MSSLHTGFTQRDEFLNSIGFQDYTEYLQSDLWESIKNSLRQHPESSQCICCKSKVGLCWHHRDYSPAIMVGNFSFASGFVVRICSPCHTAIHFSDGGFLPLNEVDYRLSRLIDSLRYPSDSSYAELLNTLDAPMDSLDDKYTDFQTPDGF